MARARGPVRLCGSARAGAPTPQACPPVPLGAGPRPASVQSPKVTGASSHQGLLRPPVAEPTTTLPASPQHHYSAPPSLSLRAPHARPPPQAPAPMATATSPFSDPGSALRHDPFFYYQSEEHQCEQASTAEGRRPESCAASPLPEGPRVRLVREPSLSAPSSPAGATPSSRRPSSHSSADSPGAFLSPGDASTTPSRGLRAYALGTTAWVDPNELGLDISVSSAALRQRRRGRRARSTGGVSTSASTGAEGQAGANFEDAGTSKAERRAARSQRLQKLLVEVARKGPANGQNELLSFRFPGLQE